MAVGASAWEALRAELGVDEVFPEEVVAEAERAAAAPRLPELDRTDVVLCTIDPVGSRDLDQAVGFERVEHGFVVHYAIADVAAFVTPGGALDRESHRRGETLYGPDRRVPMLPPVLSESAASLLPEQVRPALLWRFELDRGGELTSAAVERARVRSARQLDYGTVDAALAGEGRDEQLLLLREVGRLREEIARRRSSVRLPSLEQVVGLDDDDRPRLVHRAPARSEAWNAEISLLTGMAAARTMLTRGVGILRTLPAPDPAAIAQLRQSAHALGVPWPASAPYADVVSALDPHRGPEAALLALVPRLLRGAGYVAFDGQPPADHVHSAVAAPYTHCTAPLRRLVDRYAGEICLAACADEPVPDWVGASLALLPEEMAAADHRAHALERATIDLAEALVLQTRIGHELPATVVSVEGDKGIVQVADPAVRAPVVGPDLRAGTEVRVVVVEADPVARKVVFRVAGEVA